MAAFDEYPGMELSKGKGGDNPGGGKGPPIVPESAATGAIFIALVVLFMIVVRWINKVGHSISCRGGCNHKHHH